MQERAFYDTHRNVPIAATDDDLFDHVRNGDKARSDPDSKLNKRRRGDPGVRLEQLMRFFDPKIARKVDDTNEVSDPCGSLLTGKGFYSVYRSLFALLATDESLHADETIEYPSFGDSSTPYTPASDLPRSARDETPCARDFYLAWANFSTAKRFDWVSKWDVERGDDRSMRRLMEKENKKIRDDYKKEYNATVQVRREVQALKFTAATRVLCAAPRPSLQKPQSSGSTTQTCIRFQHSACARSSASTSRRTDESGCRISGTRLAGGSRLVR